MAENFYWRVPSPSRPGRVYLFQSNNVYHSMFESNKNTFFLVAKLLYIIQRYVRSSICQTKMVYMGQDNGR